MIFRKASQAIPLLTASLLVLSIIYDYFYIKSLGLNFYEIPTTISDHARSSIVWIGGAVFYLCLFLPYRIFKSVFFSSVVRVRQFAIGVLMAIFGWVLYFSYVMYDWETVFAVVFFIISFLTFVFLEEIGKLFSRNLVIFGEGNLNKFLLSVLAMAILVASHGWIDGRLMLNSKVNKVIVQIRTVTGVKSFEKIGIRRFDNIVLLIGVNNQVEILRGEDIISVTHKVARGRN